MNFVLEYRYNVEYVEAGALVVELFSSPACEGTHCLPCKPIKDIHSLSFGPDSSAT